MPSRRNNSIFSFVYWLFGSFVKLFSDIQVLEPVNSNVEMVEQQTEIDPMSNSPPVSPTQQPTVNSLTAGLSGNVAIVELQPGAETTTLQQIEIRIPESSVQSDQSLPLQTPDQVEAFKYGVKVAIWATTISSGVTTVWIGFLVNQTNTPNYKFFAKASLLSIIASFITSLIIFILSFIRPKFQGIATIVKIIMLVTIGSTVLVVGFGVAFYFQKSGW